MIWKLIHIIDITLWLFMGASVVYVVFFGLVCLLLYLGGSLV
jgi:hypothetical protein